MKNNPLDILQASEFLEDASGPGPKSDVSSQPWHSVSLSSLPSDYSEHDEALERSFRELVHYYRHSSVGRRCLGIVHQMNTPLQVLSFQLDLLEQKAREELELLRTSLTGAEKLETLNLSRQEKFCQLRSELETRRQLRRHSQ